MSDLTSTQSYYDQVVSRTVSKNTYSYGVSFNKYSSYLDYLAIVADLTSKLKATLFYGKENPDFIDDNLTHKSSVAHKAPYFSKYADTIHALLGLIDESCELLENITINHDDESISLQNIAELGDLSWFYTLLLKSMSALKPDMDLDQFLNYVRNANMAKLSVRYPDGFSSDSAINRNTHAEDLAISEI
jgi:hypothetical protein